MDDQALLHAVTEELEWAPHLDATRVTIDVHDGIVRLGGVVATLAEKHAAEHAVWHIRGVTGLVQDIAVRLAAGADTNDADLAERAQSVLRWDAQIPDQRIRLKVEDGIVTLMGGLDWQYQREEAEERIRRLAGVRGVVNDITVQPGHAATDIAAAVGRALARHAELDATRITATVEGAAVILSGTVRSLTARRAAENATWSAPGVASVENRLTVAR